MEKTTAKETKETKKTKKTTETKKTKVLHELYNICVDTEAKASDRISAAKLFLDNMESDEGSDDAVLKVVFENVEEEFVK